MHYVKGLWGGYFRERALFLLHFGVLVEDAHYVSHLFPSK